MEVSSKLSKEKGGFTLVELLVVISIIGFLSSIVLSSLGAIRVKARDARRVTDFRQIETALNLYYNDNRSYPGTNSVISRDESWSDLANHLVMYLSPLPKDPLNRGPLIFPYYTNNYAYQYICEAGGCQDYDLITQFEDKNNSNRCELRCWRQNRFVDTTPRPPWCNCPGEIGGFSPYIYSDH